jgi:hypothetical protein
VETPSPRLKDPKAGSAPRFVRLTEDHSKKIDTLSAFYTCWYNFACINSSVRMSPAMAAHLTDRLWDIGDIVKLIEGWESADEPQARVNAVPDLNERTGH